MAMWNPWRGCKKCSDGCLHCYIHKGDAKRGVNTNDIVKTIFAWIGIIVVVLVVGTIIITILNEILPYNWWNKYRYIIYPAGLALGRWLQKEFNW